MEKQGTITARGMMDGGTQLIPSLGQHSAFVFPEFDMLLLHKGNSIFFMEKTGNRKMEGKKHLIFLLHKENHY